VIARNNASCTQARKATHDLDGQHQDVDRTLRGRVSQNDREDRDKWRKYVYGVAETRIEDGDRTGQNRTVKESLNRDILTETSSRANVAHHCRWVSR